MAIVDDRAEAEELAQEILLAAHAAMPRFEGRSLVRTWLYAIARRTCRRRLRQRERRRELLTAWPAAAPAGSPALVDPLEHAFARAARHRLRLALAQLPARQQEVLLLRYVGGLSYREVAACCRVREATARQRCCSALRRLRGLLTGQEGAPAMGLGCPTDEEVTR
jgi:RNA polymerase sigma-70 factor (ECF subfamily)